MAENKFPTEVIDLPSEGKLYPKDSPLRSGKIELKYMTAKEEDILTSQNLIKKGVVIEKLLESLIVTEGVKPDDLVLGDRNAIMVAARILAYGPEYDAEITDPTTGEKTNYTFNLADCPFKKLSSAVKSNEFNITLPISKKEIKFKILTGKEDKKIENEVNARKKLGSDVSPELTTRLKHTIIEVDGSVDTFDINNFVDNMLSRDSLFLRQEIRKVVPDIELKQSINVGGESVEVDIPLSVNFFWPNS
jgi:hypothetical protein